MVVSSLISQIGSFPLVGVKIKKSWNHHLLKLDLWVKDLLFQHKEMYVFFQATPFLTSATYLLQLVVLSPRIRGTVDYTQRMPQKSPKMETNLRSFGRNRLKLWNFMILFLTFKRCFWWEKRMLWKRSLQNTCLTYSSGYQIVLVSSWMRDDCKDWDVSWA